MSNAKISIDSSQDKLNRFARLRDSALAERDLARKECEILLARLGVWEKDEVARDLFIATVSHDLLNPAGVIKMAIDLLRMDKSGDRSQSMYDLIDRNAEKIEKLITLLLDTHLIKSGGHLPIKIGKCDLLSIIENCTRSLNPTEQVRITLKIAPNERILGDWDAGALQRVFNNLIGNALKFSCEDQKIQISASQDDTVTTVTIHNSGRPISVADQSKLFDSHFRVPNNVSQGWGLGLTLVKGIVESHGGKIAVTSNKIDGTIFALTLPNECQS